MSHSKNTETVQRKFIILYSYFRIVFANCFNVKFTKEKFKFLSCQVKHANKASTLHEI